MKQLEKRDKKKFYEINEMVVKTSPMRTHYNSTNVIERWIWQKKKKIIQGMLNDLIYKDIIDIGCGDGGLFKLVRDNCNYTGIDISPTQITYFKKKLAFLKNNRPKLLRVDAANLPFNENSFDVALVCDVLEHVLDPVLVMKEVKRVVKKGGFVIFNIPNEELLQLVRLFTFRFPLRSPDHLYSLSVDDIKQYFPKIIQHIGIPFTLASAFNLLNVLLVENEDKK